MESKEAIEAFAALAQETRLEAFRLLVRCQPEGIAAGELARMIGVPQNTLSAHLAVLTRAGLVSGVRNGRQIVYHADLDGLRQVILHLLNDCCGGRPEICAPLIEALSPCCPKKEASPKELCP